MPLVHRWHYQVFKTRKTFLKTASPDIKALILGGRTGPTVRMQLGMGGRRDPPHSSTFDNSNIKLALRRAWAAARPNPPPLRDGARAARCRTQCQRRRLPARRRWVYWWVWLCWRRRAPSSSVRRSWASRGGCRRSWAPAAPASRPAPTPRSRTSSGARRPPRSPAKRSTWRWGPAPTRSPSAPGTSSCGGTRRREARRGAAPRAPGLNRAAAAAAGTPWPPTPAGGARGPGRGGGGRARGPRHPYLPFLVTIISLVSSLKRSHRSLSSSATRSSRSVGSPFSLPACSSLSTALSRWSTRYCGGLPAPSVPGLLMLAPRPAGGADALAEPRTAAAAGPGLVPLDLRGPSERERGRDRCYTPP